MILWQFQITCVKYWQFYGNLNRNLVPRALRVRSSRALGTRLFEPPWNLAWIHSKSRLNSNLLCLTFKKSNLNYIFWHSFVQRIRYKIVLAQQMQMVSCTSWALHCEPKKFLKFAFYIINKYPCAFACKIEDGKCSQSSKLSKIGLRQFSQKTEKFLEFSSDFIYSKTCKYLIY